MYPSSTICYGFEFDFSYDSVDDDFLDELYLFLKKRGLTWVEAGYAGNNDEPFGVIGIEKNYRNYVSKFNPTDIQKLEQDGKNLFTDELLKEVYEFLGIKKPKVLQLFIISTYS